MQNPEFIDNTQPDLVDHSIKIEPGPSQPLKANIEQTYEYKAFVDEIKGDNIPKEQVQYQIIRVKTETHRKLKEYVAKNPHLKLHSLIEKALNDWLTVMTSNNLYNEVKFLNDVILHSMSKITAITQLINSK